MTSIPYRRFAALASAMAIAMAGCSGSGSGDGTGRISIGISDGPVHEASKVCVAFDEIEIKGEGPAMLIEPTGGDVDNINLLDFQGANAAPLLMNYEIPAGDYQWVRLGVNAVRGGTGGTGDAGDDCVGEESYIVTPDGTYNLYVPSGENNGLKLVSGFTVAQGGTMDFTAEFNLMSSVTAPDGLSPDVLLRPTIRLVNNLEVGTLTGQVTGDPPLVTAENCQPSVFVFADGVMPNAIDMDMDDPDDPIATAVVAEQRDELQPAEYHYTVGFLLEGSYEVAFTCDDGATFEPADGKPADIVAGEVTEVPFP